MSAVAAIEEVVDTPEPEDIMEKEPPVVKDYRYQVGQRLKILFPELYDIRADDGKLVDYLYELPKEAIGLMHVYMQYYEFPLRERYYVQYNAYKELIRLTSNVSKYLITKCENEPHERYLAAVQVDINSLNRIDFKIDQYIAKNRKKAQNSYKGLKFKLHNSNYYEQDLQTMPILRNAIGEW